MATQQFIQRNTDGGWAWVVLASSFLTRVVMGGLMWIFNIYFIVLHEEFGEPRSVTAAIGSVAIASFHLTAPVSSYLIGRMGLRKTMVTGSILLTLNYLISMHANGVIFLIITHAVFFGIGFNLMSNSSIISLSVYFNKYAFLATGVSLAGTGIGVFIFSSTMPIAIDVYGWRGSLLLVAGLCFQTCAAGFVIFPMQKKNIEESKKRRPHSRELLSSLRFWLLNLSYFFFTVCFVSVVILYKDFALLGGLSMHFVHFMYAVGVGDIIGRLITGYFSSHPKVNLLLLFAGTHCACSATVLLHGAITDDSHALFYICGFLFGVLSGALITLNILVPLHVFGKEMMVVAIGYVQTAAGLGALIGPPLSGLITDATNSYDWTLRFAAASLLNASLCAVAVYFLERKRKDLPFSSQTPETEKLQELATFEQELCPKNGNVLKA